MNQTSKGKEQGKWKRGEKEGTSNTLKVSEKAVCQRIADENSVNGYVADYQCNNPRLQHNAHYVKLQVSRQRNDGSCANKEPCMYVPCVSAS